jgi:hypothetical protein
MFGFVIRVIQLVIILKSNKMKKFIALYHAPDDAFAAVQNHKLTEAELEESKKPWGEWYQKNSNAIIELGAPIGTSESLNTKGEWTASSKGVRGYSIVQAADKEAAHELFKNHVHLNRLPEATVELHEVMGM